MRFAAFVCCLFLAQACGPNQSSLSSPSSLPDHRDPGHDAGAFPIGPNESVTPGKVCDRPDTYRYPEHIAYCEREIGRAHV